LLTLDQGGDMPSRPTHFEIPVDDPDRAEGFYASVFGWTFQRYPGAPQYYGMATTGETAPGINGALFQRGSDSETTLTMSVDSIEETTAKIMEEGGKVIQGKTAVPSMGRFRVQLAAGFGRGVTEIGLPPFGHLTADTHLAPLRLTATLVDVRLPQLAQDVADEGIEGVSRRVQHDASSRLAPFFLHLVG